MKEVGCYVPVYNADLSSWSSGLTNGWQPVGALTDSLHPCTITLRPRRGRVKPPSAGLGHPQWHIAARRTSSTSVVVWSRQLNWSTAGAHTRLRGQMSTLPPVRRRLWANLSTVTEITSIQNGKIKENKIRLQQTQLTFTTNTKDRVWLEDATVQEVY